MIELPPEAPGAGLTTRSSRPRKGMHVFAPRRGRKPVHTGVPLDARAQLNRTEPNAVLWCGLVRDGGSPVRARATRNRETREGTMSEEDTLMQAERRKKTMLLISAFALLAIVLALFFLIPNPIG